MIEADSINEKYNNPHLTDMTQMLFHGSSVTSPEVIFQSEEGFDLRFSNNGYWGRAVYFAKNSFYSNAYCYTNVKEGNRQMFYAKVNLGHSKQLE